MISNLTTQSKTLTNEQFTKKRNVILVASCVANLCVGSIYSWSVFSTPMAQHFALTQNIATPDLSFVFTITTIMSTLMMIFGGIINDKLGPKQVVLVGSVLFGGGMFASGFATSPLMLMFTYGVCLGLGEGLVYGSLLSNAVKSYPDKPGTAGGIITTFYGLSSVFMPVIANVLIEAVSITFAFQSLGIVMFLLIAFVSTRVQAPPSNYFPESNSKGHSRKSKNREVSDIGTTMQTVSALDYQNNLTWKEMIRTPQFYLMFIMLLCSAFSGLMIISQASPIAQGLVGFSVSQAAFAVSVLALFNTLGRLVSGFVCDRLGVIATLRIIFSGMLIGLLGLIFVSPGNSLVFYAGLCLIGFGYGSTMSVYPAFCAEQFGRAHNSVNYGVLFVAFSVACILGPQIMSVIFATFSIYQPAFIIAAILVIISLAITIIFQRKYA